MHQQPSRQARRPLLAPPGRTQGPRHPPFRFVALLLTAAILAVFPLQALLPEEELILVSAAAAERPWTLLTSIFLHGSALHVLGNAFALAFFGSVLEKLLGWRKFLLIFLLGGVASSLGDLLFYDASLGASGAVFGILGALTLLKPRMPVPAFGIPLPMVAATVLWALLDLSGLFYPDGVAHVAHLVGLGAGVVLALLLSDSLPPERRPQIPLPVDPRGLQRWEDYWMQKPYPEGKAETIVLEEDEW